MATIKLPTPGNNEDTPVRFQTDAETNQRNMNRRFNKKTYVLTDGPHSGDTVEYVAEEVDVTVSSAAVTVADGADVAEGSTTDAAVDTDANGTVNGHLRGLVKLFVNLLSRIPAALGAGGGLKVDGSGTALPVSGPLTDTQLRATPVPISGAVTTSGTVTEANSAAIAASLSVIDDWDESDRAKVNPIVGQAGVAAGAGAVGVTVPRTTLASDDPAVASLGIMDDWDESDRAKVNTIAGQVGVQGASGTVTALTQRVVLATDVALPTGSNAIGKLAANSGVDIGDVDVTSIAAGDNIVGRVRANGVSGQIYDANAGETRTIKVANGVATASGDNVVLALVSSRKIRVLSYALQCQETGTVTARFQDNATATNRTMPWFLTAGTNQNDGVSRAPAGGDGHFYFETASGVGLDLNLSSALDTGWEVTYVEVV